MPQININQIDMSPGKLLGRSSTASGVVEEVTLGDYLVMSGGVLAVNLDTALTDLYSYVDNAVQGLDAKASVLTATSGNIVLSGEQTLGGIVTSQSRVLVKDQSNLSENGIYISGPGAWTRANDMSDWSEVPGAFVFVESGTHGGTGWVCTSVAGGTIDLTALTWAQFSGAGTYTASGGLILVGTDIRLANSPGLTLKGNNSASSGAPTDLTISQVKAMLGIATVDDAALAGKEPVIAAGTTSQYLRGDKTWATLDKTAVGLSDVDNTSDADKPLSIAAISALAGKEPVIAAGTVSDYLRGDKTWGVLDKAAVGLANVDNTSDANKPISTAQQAALNLKAPLASPSFTGIADFTEIMVGGLKNINLSEIAFTNYLRVGQDAADITAKLHIARAETTTTNIEQFHVYADSFQHLDGTTPLLVSTPAGLSVAGSIKSNGADVLARTSHTGTQPISTITMASGKLLGRTTVGNGTVEEITIGDGLSFVGGTLTSNATGTGFAPIRTTGTGAAQNITLPLSGLLPQDVLVFVNGTRMESDEYTITGDTLTLMTAASGDSIEIIKPAGTTGAPGAVGQGVIAGGTTNQVLAKASGADFDTVWTTLTKASVGLSSVDNTSDTNKPVSTATQTALDLKADASALALKADLTALALKADISTFADTSILTAVEKKSLVGINLELEDRFNTAITNAATRGYRASTNNELPSTDKLDTWTLGNITRTLNAAADPDGNMTATKLEGTAPSVNHVISSAHNQSTAGWAFFAINVKEGGGYKYLRLNTDQSFATSIYFDIKTGKVASVVGNTILKSGSYPVGGGWRRYFIVYWASGADATNTCFAYLTDQFAAGVSAGFTGGSAFVCRAQAGEGLIIPPYTPAVAANTAPTAGSVIADAVVNAREAYYDALRMAIPAYDDVSFDSNLFPADNLISSPLDMSAAPWNIGGSVARNGAFFTITDNDPAARTSVGQTRSVDFGNQVTAAVKFKKDAVARSTRYPSLRLSITGITTYDLGVDTSTGEVNVGGGVPTDYGVKDAGDSWFVWVTAPAGTGTERFDIYPAFGTVFGAADNSLVGSADVKEPQLFVGTMADRARASLREREQAYRAALSALEIALLDTKANLSGASFAGTVGILRDPLPGYSLSVGGTGTGAIYVTPDLDSSPAAPAINIARGTVELVMGSSDATSTAFAGTYSAHDFLVFRGAVEKFRVTATGINVTGAIVATNGDITIDKTGGTATLLMRPGTAAASVLDLKGTANANAFNLTAQTNGAFYNAAQHVFRSLASVNMATLSSTGLNVIGSLDVGAGASGSAKVVFNRPASEGGAAPAVGDIRWVGAGDVLQYNNNNGGIHSWRVNSVEKMSLSSTLLAVAGRINATDRVSAVGAMADDNNAAFSNTSTTGYGLYSRGGGNGGRYIATFNDYNDTTVLSLVPGLLSMTGSISTSGNLVSKQGVFSDTAFVAASAGQGRITGFSTTGCVIYGSGTQYDVSIGASNGTTAIGVKPGSANIDLLGNVAIGATSFSGAVPRLGVKTNQGDWALQVEGHTAAGSSYGLRIVAGTNNTDYPFLVHDTTATKTLLALTGAGKLIPYDSVSSTVKLENNNTIIGYPVAPSHSLSRQVYDLASFRAHNSALVGAIVFTAPTGADLIMHNFTVVGNLYNVGMIDFMTQVYRSAGAAFVGGFANHSGDQKPMIRWAVNANGRTCLILGDTNTSWSYPHISIASARFSHTNVSDAYCTGWTASSTTDLSTYTAVTSNLTSGDKSTANQANFAYSADAVTIPDTRAVNVLPQDTIDHGLTLAFKNVGTVGSPPVTPHGAYAHIMTVNGYDSGGSGGYPSQLSFGDGLAVRLGTSSTTWGPWRKVWHSGNFDADAITATGLGITGAGTLNNQTDTPAEWSSLPVGYARMMKNTIGIAGGAPVNNHGFFTKIAHRDASGGWAGLWAGYSDGENYIGRTLSSASFATWDKLWSSANFDPTSPPAISTGLKRTAHNVGHLEGSYNNVGANSAMTNPIYTIGSAYNPTTTALSNMYGIGYTNASSAAFISITGATDWGAYIAGAGTARVFLGANTGVVASTGEHYVAGNKVWHAGDTAFNAATYNVAAVSGNGLRFWGGSTVYSIQMSQAGDASYGGRVAGETTSDYNMYFTMNGGVNRGFVFRTNNNNTSAVAGIDAGGNFRTVGRISTSAAGNASNAQLALDGATSNWISFNTNGLGSPTTSSRSAGTKIVLYPSLSGSEVDYALGIDNGTLWQSISSSAYNFKWFAGTANVATLSGAGDFTATGNLSAYSDQSIKTNIETIQNALDKVCQMRGVHYDRIDNGHHGSGVIAQEIERVAPELVTENDNGLKSVAYGNTVGYLIEAVKELKVQNDELRREVEALKKPWWKFWR